MVNYFFKLDGISHTFRILNVEYENRFFPESFLYNCSAVCNIENKDDISNYFNNILNTQITPTYKQDVWLSPIGKMYDVFLTSYNYIDDKYIYVDFSVDYIDMNISVTDIRKRKLKSIIER